MTKGETVGQNKGREPMFLDDWYDHIDGDPEVIETVDELLARLRSYKVVKLDFYRRMVTEYRGWKPLSLADYALKVHGSQLQIVKRELERARQAQNKRVTRAYKLTPK